MGQSRCLCKADLRLKKRSGCIWFGLFLALCLFPSVDLIGQEVQLAVLQYKGGGDWYSNPTSVPNLVTFCNEEMGTDFSEEVPYVEVGYVGVVGSVRLVVEWEVSAQQSGGAPGKEGAAPYPRGSHR